MLTRVLFPLLIVPIFVFGAFGGLSYYWYHQTFDILAVRTDQFNRLQRAKAELSVLEPQEASLNRLKTRFSEVDNVGCLDAVKLYLSKKSNPNVGVKLEDYRLLGAASFVKNYGSIALRFTCRSEAISEYLADVMNAYPNIIFTQWDMSASPSSKLLQFNSTAILAKISEK
jgi:hypothetical protein